MALKDGHIHTPFCSHGTTDELEEYIERALSLGLREISFTEHAPLPEGFEDVAPDRDSAMPPGRLDGYFEEIKRVKERYKGRIAINAGLEVDYIEGYEKKTAGFLSEAGPELDDAILSVHFIRHSEGYDCIDFSPEAFKTCADKHGGIENLHRKYYRTVLASIRSDLGPYKPRRIGHMTPANKFQKKFPAACSFEPEISVVLKEMKTYNYELDYNGAGVAKPLCGEPYPPDWVAREALKLGIRLVYGSDAHSAKQMGQGLQKLVPFKG